MADLNRSAWTAYATTYNTSESAVPANAIDGTGAYWNSMSTMPVEFWVDMGSAIQVNYIKWLGREWPQHAGAVELYLSNDGTTWGSAVASATWPGYGFGAGTNILVFPAQTRRWIKVRVLTPAAGTLGNQISCNEFNAGYDLAMVGTLSVEVPLPVPDGTVGTPYSGYSLHITGGVSPYTVSVVSGSIPAGLSFSSTGALSGTPTTGGNFTATVRVTDAASSTRDVSFSIYVFKSGTPDPGATVNSVSIVWYTAFTWDTFDGTEALYIGDAAHPQQYYGGNSGHGFQVVFVNTIHPKTFQIALITDLAACGITVSGQDVDCSGSHFWATIAGTLAGSGLNQLSFYACHYQIDYSDGTRSFAYPNVQEVIVASGGVDNPELAIDADTNTFALIHRTSFSSLGSPSQLHLHGFGPLPVSTDVSVTCSIVIAPAYGTPTGLWLDLWVWRQLWHLDSLTETVSFLPVYRRALVMGLARELCREYGRDPAVVQQQADQAMAELEQSNVEIRTEGVKDLE